MYSNIINGFIILQYLGHLFIYIGDQEVTWQQKVLSVSILFIKRICGSDVSL